MHGQRHRSTQPARQRGGVPLTRAALATAQRSAAGAAGARRQQPGADAAAPPAKYTGMWWGSVHDICMGYTGLWWAACMSCMARLPVWLPVWLLVRLCKDTQHPDTKHKCVGRWACMKTPHRWCTRCDTTATHNNEHTLHLPVGLVVMAASLQAPAPPQPAGRR